MNVVHGQEGQCRGSVVLELQPPSAVKLSSAGSVLAVVQELPGREGPTRCRWGCRIPEHSTGLPRADPAHGQQGGKAAVAGGCTCPPPLQALLLGQVLGPHAGLCSTSPSLHTHLPMHTDAVVLLCPAWGTWGAPGAIPPRPGAPAAAAVLTLLPSCSLTLLG